MLLAQLAEVTARKERREVILDEAAARLFVARLKGRPVPCVPLSEVNVERNRLWSLLRRGIRAEHDRPVDFLSNVLGPALILLVGTKALLRAAALVVRDDIPGALDPSYL